MKKVAFSLAAVVVMMLVGCGGGGGSASSGGSGDNTGGEVEPSVKAEDVKGLSQFPAIPLMPEMDN